MFCFVLSFQMVMLSEVVGNRRVEGLQNSQKSEFRLGFFWGGLPVSLQTVNFGVMSWQNQKEWYLQIKTVFILGWGKQTIKVWRHSEILGVEIYWPKVDDSAILSFFPHGTGPVPRFWPLRGIITSSILSRFVKFEREKYSHQRREFTKKKMSQFGWKSTKLWSPKVSDFFLPQDRWDRWDCFSHSTCQLWSDILTKPKGMVPSY